MVKKVYNKMPGWQKTITMVIVVGALTWTGQYVGVSAVRARENTIKIENQRINCYDKNAEQDAKILTVGNGISKVQDDVTQLKVDISRMDGKLDILIKKMDK